LYERDPAAWQAHLAEGNARQARKRVAADVIIRNQADELLLVDPAYKPDWDLPGGMAEANEPPHETAKRELAEELGLELQVGQLLCIDCVSAHGPWDDSLVFVFDGGTLSQQETTILRPRDEELREARFCPHDETQRLLRPYVWRRAQRALEALDTGSTHYLIDGYAWAERRLDQNP